MNNRYVLIRGLVRGNGHWGNFLNVLKNLDPNCEIELYEIPGNGTRCNESTPTDPLEIINDFRKRSFFCQSKKTFILVGMSLGGMIALKWLEQFPQDVQKTYIVNSSLHSLSPFYDRFNSKNYVHIFNTLLTPNLSEREFKILKLTSNSSDLEPNLIGNLIDFSTKYPTTRINFVKQLILAKNIEVKNNLRQPIVIVQSEKDRLVNPDCSLKLSLFLNSTLKTHPTAGHDIALDDPQWLAKLIILKG